VRTRAQVRSGRRCAAPPSTKRPESMTPLDYQLRMQGILFLTCRNCPAPWPDSPWPSSFCAAPLPAAVEREASREPDYIYLSEVAAPAFADRPCAPAQHCVPEPACSHAHRLSTTRTLPTSPHTATILARCFLTAR
jgi:hypothetical protein